MSSLSAADLARKVLCKYDYGSVQFNEYGHISSYGDFHPCLEQLNDILQSEGVRFTLSKL